jgi:hypothetical protein
MGDLGLGDPPSNATLLHFINAGIAEIERRTGFKPFLGESVDQEYYYDPPLSNGILDLRAGFVSITSVRSNITCDDDDGTLLEECEDYRLYPLNAREGDRPFTEIRFARGMGGGPKSIKVTGKKGWDDEVPDDVWLSVLEIAEYLTPASLAQSGGNVSRIKQGQVEIEYGNTTTSSESGGTVVQRIIGRWSGSINAIVKRYLRITV